MSELESHVFTEIEIDATADQVWAVLTDFEKLPGWSSSFQGVNKPMALGEVSKAYIRGHNVCTLKIKNGGRCGPQMIYDNAWSQRPQTPA